MFGDDVETREDMVRYLKDMSSRVESFDNRELRTFLEAASGWLADMDGYFKNKGEEVPESNDWWLFARVLDAATIYE